MVVNSSVISGETVQPKKFQVMALLERALSLLSSDFSAATAPGIKI